MTKTCPRCGEEVVGCGKTGMCQSCATTITGKRIWRSSGNHARMLKAAQEGTRNKRVQNRRPEGYSEPSLPKFKFMEDVE